MPATSIPLSRHEAILYIIHYADTFICNRFNYVVYCNGKTAHNMQIYEYSPSCLCWLLNYLMNGRNDAYTDNSSILLLHDLQIGCAIRVWFEMPNHFMRLQRIEWFAPILHSLSLSKRSYYSFLKICSKRSYYSSSRKTIEFELHLWSGLQHFHFEIPISSNLDTTF